MTNKFNILIFLIAATFILLSSDISIFTVFTLINLYFIIEVFKTAINKKVKTTYILSYIFVYILQIVYLGFIEILKINNLYEGKISTYIILLILLFITLIVEKKFRIRNYYTFYMPYISELGDLTYNDIKLLNDKRKNFRESLSKKMNILNKDKVKELVKNISKTSSFKYINKNSLDRNYFKIANESLEDDNVYLVISNTKTAASQALSIFTNKDFNHISISFDKHLKTVVSYNGGENINKPGLNFERLEYYYKHEDSSLIIYSLKVGAKAKKSMIDSIYNINKEGSAYNFLGIPINKSFKPNIMFCSQFVYKLLEKTGVVYFKKRGNTISPTDFIEFDYYRKLVFEEEIKFEDKDKFYNK